MMVTLELCRHVCVRCLARDNEPEHIKQKMSVQFVFVPWEWTVHWHQIGFFCIVKCLQRQKKKENVWRMFEIWFSVLLQRAGTKVSYIAYFELLGYWVCRLFSFCKLLTDFYEGFWPKEVVSTKAFVLCCVQKCPVEGHREAACSPCAGSHFVFKSKASA